MKTDLAIVLAQKKRPMEPPEMDEPEAEGEDFDAMKGMAEEMLAALEDKDPEALAEVLAGLVDICKG